VRGVLILSFFMLGCAGLGTEPQNATESAKPHVFKAPGDHTPDEVYENLQTIAVESVKKESRPKTGTEFSLALPGEQPEGDQTKEWIRSQVRAVYKDQKTVDQITLSTQNCNVKLEDLDQAALNKRVQSLVALVSSTLFGLPFQLSDKYFVEPADWHDQLRIPIRQEYLPVVDMRMIRERSKCDGRGGYGYRFDFFMK
jgi:hypothetical protein